MHCLCQNAQNSAFALSQSKILFIRIIFRLNQVTFFSVQFISKTLIATSIFAVGVRLCLTLLFAIAVHACILATSACLKAGKAHTRLLEQLPKLATRAGQETCRFCRLGGDPD